MVCRCSVAGSLSARGTYRANAECLPHGDVGRTGWHIGSARLGASPAAAQAFNTLLSFSGTSGAYPGWNPNAGLVLSGSTLYGTTNAGGTYNEGTVFSVPVSGGTLHDPGLVQRDQWRGPNGGLILSGSTLYGTTEGGGASSDGTVFSLPVSGGTPTVLTSFNGNNGQWPEGGLTLIGSNLYGICNRGDLATGRFSAFPRAAVLATILTSFAEPMGNGLRAA